MSNIKVNQEAVRYRGISNVVLEFDNGDKLEVKAWDRERAPFTAYSIKLTKRGEEAKTLAEE